MKTPELGQTSQLRLKLGPPWFYTLSEFWTIKRFSSLKSNPRLAVLQPLSDAPSCSSLRFNSFLPNSAHMWHKLVEPDCWPGSASAEQLSRDITSIRTRQRLDHGQARLILHLILAAHGSCNYGHSGGGGHLPNVPATMKFSAAVFDPNRRAERKTGRRHQDAQPRPDNKLFNFSRKLYKIPKKRAHKFQTVFFKYLDTFSGCWCCSMSVTSTIIQCNIDCLL